MISAETSASMLRKHSHFYIGWWRYPRNEISEHEHSLQLSRQQDEHASKYILAKNMQTQGRGAATDTLCDTRGCSHEKDLERGLTVDIAN